MFSAGIDLVEINRIEKVIQNRRFIEKYFGNDEIKELENKKFRAESVAACFAAKEAFSKVIKTGISGFSLSEVQLLHEKSGAPYLKFSGKAQKKAEDLGLKFTVSVTHTRELAQAIVIGYTD